MVSTQPTTHSNRQHKSLTATELLCFIGFSTSTPPGMDSAISRRESRSSRNRTATPPAISRILGRCVSHPCSSNQPPPARRRRPRANVSLVLPSPWLHLGRVPVGCDLRIQNSSFPLFSFIYFYFNNIKIIFNQGERTILFHIK